MAFKPSTRNRKAAWLRGDRRLHRRDRRPCRLTEKSLFTQYGAMVGTLEYMSPEQAEMSAIDIDTRSDIYSLGVLLNELLTGSTPFDKERFKQAPHHPRRGTTQAEHANQG